MVDSVLIAALRRTLVDRAGIRLAVLFGSRARGDARPGSDVDVAVLGDGIDSLRLAAELSRELGLDVDVVDLADPSIPLVRAVLRDGIPVHQSPVGAWGTFIAQSLCDLETDLPSFRRMQDAFVERVAARGLLDER